jgi:hypothetical protein
MLGDHEAMHILLTDLDDSSRLGFMTALASIAASTATQGMGREKALTYLQAVAEQSAALADATD